MFIKSYYIYFSIQRSQSRTPCVFFNADHKLLAQKDKFRNSNLYVLPKYNSNRVCIDQEPSL